MQIMIASIIVTGLGYLMHQGLKFAALIIISKHSELSATKVKYLTHMISKDKNSRKSK